MSTERFNVVLEGTVLLGHEPAVVKEKLATLIKRDALFAGRLLSGRPTTLKSGVDAATGARYVATLERAGVAVRLEPETLEVDADLSVPAPIAAPRQTLNPTVVVGVAKAERIAANGTLGGDNASRPSPPPARQEIDATPAAAPVRPRPWKPMTAFPNVLFFVLVFIQLTSAWAKAGWTLSVRGLAEPLGEATAFLLLPLLAGVAWNFERGEGKAIKWIFVVITGLFLLVFVGSQLQTRRVAQSTENRPTASEAPSTIPASKVTPPIATAPSVSQFVPSTTGPQEVMVVIGHAGPLTGGIGHLGRDDENGARLALDQANAKDLVIGGKMTRFRILSIDDQADPSLALRVAQRFVDAGAAGVVGHLNSGVTIPASAVYNQAGIPVISGSATNPKLTEQGFKVVFRTVGRDDQQGPAVAAYVANQLKAKKVAIADDATAYGEGLANEVEKTLKAAGVAVVAREKTNDKATDFKAILTKMKGKNPDVIFYGGMDATGGPMIKQARELGIKAVFAFGDGACTSEMTKLGGPASEGMICSQAGIPTQMASKSFQDAFKAKYGEVKQYAPFFYDGAGILIAAMQKADSTDPAKYLPEVAKISYDGATGHIEFDEKGDRKDAEMTIFQMKGGNVEPIAIIKGRAIHPIAFAGDVRSESVTITDSPIPFSAAAPAGWSRQPPATGNSRLKYVSPNGTPYAECTVIVKSIPAMRGHPQSEMDAAMLQAPDPSSIAQGLAGSFNNVRVISAGNASLSGVPAQTYDVQYSVGSPAGEQWIRSVTTTALTVPDVSWTVGCGGQGRTLAGAQKAFGYWQLEFMKFATYIKFVR